MRPGRDENMNDESDVMRARRMYVEEHQPKSRPVPTHGIEYIVKDRQRGKTNRLVNWVQGGEKINRGLGWSRVIVVPNNERREWMLRMFRSRNLPPIHQGQVVTLREIGLQYGRHWEGVEFAIDDYDEIIRLDIARLGGSVRMIALTGQSVEAEIETLRWALEHSREEIEQRIQVLREQVQHLDGVEGEELPLSMPEF